MQPSVINVFCPQFQHPDLTKGQKRYLWSICSIYSTAQMKQLIQDQFLRQLFYEMKKGINTCRLLNGYFDLVKVSVVELLSQNIAYIPYFS